MEYRRSVIAQNESIAASAVTTYDLPVNPLSHLNFTMRFLNVTDEATLAEILSRLTKIEVTRFGAAITSISGADLHKLNAVLLKRLPILSNQIATDNAARSISLVIPFGRTLYNPAECLPATTKGELKLQITLDGTETALDNIKYQIEAVELLGATPKAHLKVTTVTQTMASGVDNDTDLPIGNKLAGILLFSTTIPATTVYTTTIDRFKFLMNNVEKMIQSTNWESLHGDLINRLGHNEVYDASADNDDVANYALVDFSPSNDDTFLVDTKGASRVVTKITAGDASAVRIMPLEIVSA